MNAPFARTFRLVPRGGAGLACDDDGVALGPVSLVEAWRDEAGKLRFRAKPLAELGKAMRLAYGEAEREAIARHHRGLSRIAELLEAGQSTRARIHAVQLGFPDIDDDGMTKLARAATLRKFNPDWASEDRVADGEVGAGDWTDSGGGGGAGTKPKPKKPPPEDIPAKKQRFVDDHLDDAQKAADQLHVPVENILGLSALEGGWGVDSRFAKDGNNFFGLHYPSPYASGYVVAKDWPHPKVATFGSYADGLRSFVARYGNVISGISDPQEFARLLQNTGAFGINPDGSKRQDYVPNVASTICGLRPYIAPRRSGP